MNPNDFGRLVKALRQSSVDESGNRLTREKLSEMIHLTPFQLGRIERGERKHLDIQTLQLLAKSLNLTDLEQKEFLYAPIGLAEMKMSRFAEKGTAINDLFCPLDKLLLPAFIMDVYADMVAANSPLLKLWMLTPELLAYSETIPAGFNVLNFMYSPLSGFKAMIGPQWRKYALTEISLFRRASLRYRHTDYFQYIINTLLKENDFEIDWYASQKPAPQYNINYVHYDYVHPAYGPLSYLITETIIHAGTDNLYLISYNPLDERTISVFTDLVEPGNFYVQKIAGWPEKKIIA